MSILTNKETVNIYRKYSGQNTDNHMQKMYDNLEKNSPWISVKNNNKTNKFKKKIYTTNYKPDPYKFLHIPINFSLSYRKALLGEYQSKLAEMDDSRPSSSFQKHFRKFQ